MDVRVLKCDHFKGTHATLLTDEDNFNLGFSNGAPSNAANSAEFSPLLSVLNQRSHSTSLSPMLIDCIKNVPGVTVMPSNSDVEKKIALFFPVIEIP